MLLITFLTFLTFINSFTPRIVSFVMNFTRKDAAVIKISSEIADMKKELNLISVVDEFAKYAKLARKILKLQEEKNALIAANSNRKLKLKTTLLFAVYGLTSVIMFTVVLMYRNEAVAKLPAQWLWPVPYIFSWFSDVPGCISVPSWIIISSTAFRIIEKNI